MTAGLTVPVVEKANGALIDAQTIYPPTAVPNYKELRPTSVAQNYTSSFHVADHQCHWFSHRFLGSYDLKLQKAAKM